MIEAAQTTAEIALLWIASTAAVVVFVIACAAVDHWIANRRKDRNR